jgi:hypothetical protein
MKTFKILHGSGSGGVNDLQGLVEAALNDDFELVGHPFCDPHTNTLYQGVVKDEPPQREVLPTPHMVG